MNATALYLDLMINVLTDFLYLDNPGDRDVRTVGRDWPQSAETMIGVERMRNLQFCMESALADDVPGDVIECGVWRGGATIFMRAVLAAHEVTDRTVWVADSFRGLPPPDADTYPADANDCHHEMKELSVSADEVRANFTRYGMLDSQVQFLEGWFADTLVDAPIGELMVLRLDGDMYGSTWDAVTALYPRLSPGGFCIVDDYALHGARQAIDDYRAAESIAAELVEVDWTGVYWRKP